MNDLIDARLANWLAEEPERGSRDGLVRTLEVTRRTRQRAAWQHPSRWLPLEPVVAFGQGPRVIAYGALVVLLLAALLAAALIAGSRPRLPEPFGLAGNGLIAYASRGEIYVAEPDGSRARALPSEPGRHFGPTFSPTGDRIAYWSRPVAGGPTSLIVANSDGSDARDVIAGADIPAVNADSTPSWSPGGIALAFVTTVEDSNDLVIARVDAREVRKVPLGSDAIDWVSWSPTGEVIAFRRTADPVVSLVIVRVDGTNERQLVTETIAPSEPGDPGGHAYNLRRALQGFVWSPSGAEIAYTSSSADIRVVDLDGNIRAVASDPELAEFNPAWSPTGARLAFYGDNGDSIVVVNRDGTGRTTFPAVFTRPCLLFWSPDERLLLGSVGSGCPTEPGRLVALDLGTGQVDTLGADVTADGLPSWQRVAP